MKFMLKGECQLYQKNLYRFVFWFPANFIHKRIGANFDESTGLLELYSDRNEGCLIGWGTGHKANQKRVQVTANKWLPTMPKKGFKREVEWKNGKCVVKICEPVRRIKPEDDTPSVSASSSARVAPEKSALKIKEKAQTAALCKQPDNSGYTDEEIARKAIKFLNKFVSENDDHRFEIADGELKVSRTIVEYL